MEEAFLFCASSAAFLCYAKLQQKPAAQADKAKKVSRKDASLKNSVKRYDRHLLIVYKRGYRWGKDIAEEGSAGSGSNFAYELSQAIGACEELGKVKLTGCVMQDEQGVVDNDECRDIILYPDAAYISGVARSQIQLFVQELNSGNLSSFAHKACPWEKVALVCTHAERDKRCGAKGKEYFHKLNALYEARNSGGAVRVFESSHLGGHEFAPTLVTYPTSDYFGNLDVADIESLSSCFDACGSCDLSDVTFHRGNAGCKSTWLKVDSTL